MSSGQTTKIAKRMPKELLKKKKVNANDHRLLKILKISDQIKLENTKLAYKTKHSQLPEKVQLSCKTDSNRLSLVKTHRYHTRQKTELNLPRAATKSYKNSFLFQSIVDYQKLPAELKKMSHYPLFIRKVKEFLLSRPS